MKGVSERDKGKTMVEFTMGTFSVNATLRSRNYKSLNEDTKPLRTTEKNRGHRAKEDLKSNIPPFRY